MAQVVPLLTPQPLPPWSSLSVFTPVPFAQLWSRNPDEGLAPEDTPVKTRQQPGYESVGIRAGAWMFEPSLTFGGFYDSNVFASNVNKQGDIAAVAHPMLAVSSLWDRHSLNITADLNTAHYREHPGLDWTDASLRARGRIDVRHDIAILTGLRVARLHEGIGSLASPAGAVEPTPYTFASADVTYWQQFNRLALSGGLRADAYDYGSTRAQNGSVISVDSRDGRVNVAHGRVDYAISPALAMFSALEVNGRDLRGTATRSLSSSGYRSLSGFNFRLTHLISGEIGAGYASQQFKDPTIGTIQGPAYRVLLTWSPSRLLDIHFKAEEIVTEASETIASGVRADSAQLGLDYEFRRNVVVSLAAAYEKDAFVGQARKDDVYAALAEIKYLLNRHGSVSARYRYIKRDSSVPASSYDKHEVGINVTARF